MRESRLLWHALAITCICAACTQAADREAAPSLAVDSLAQVNVLQLVDSVMLRESDSLYVGQAVAMAVDGDGEIYISDSFSSRVLRYKRDGTLRQTYGRKGAGPGEFLGPLSIDLRGDSGLVVIDFPAGQVEEFDRRSGAPTGVWPYTGPAGSLVVGVDTAWIGVLNFTKHTGVAKLSLGDSNLVHVTRWPEEYIKAPQLAQIHASVHIALDDTSLFVGYSGYDGIFTASRAGNVLDTIPVPAVRRRGTPPDLAQRLLDDRSAAGVTKPASFLWNLSLLPGGELAVTHVDLDIADERNVAGARGYLSVIAPDRKSACVDIPLRLVGIARPQVAFREDTLITLEQVVVGESAAAFVKRYALDLKQCEWMQMH